LLALGEREREKGDTHTYISPRSQQRRRRRIGSSMESDGTNVSVTAPVSLVISDSTSSKLLNDSSRDIDEVDQFPGSAFLSENDVTKVDTIIIEGFLKKKSPKGIPGFKAWQQRYFVLTPDKLKYYPDLKKEKALGAVPILMIDRIDLAKLDKECRLDLILLGEQSRKFALRAASKDLAHKWNKALVETMVSAKSKCEDTKDMRKFSVKYWKGQEKKIEGPSPVDRALAHVTKKDNEIKSFAGIGKEKPQLFLLSAALLHGIRTALTTTCSLRRKISIEIIKISGLNCEDGHVKATLELRGHSAREEPANLKVESEFVACEGGVANFNKSLEIDIPNLMVTTEAEIEMVIYDKNDTVVGMVKVPLSECIEAKSNRELKLSKGGVLLISSTYSSETSKPPSSGNFHTDLKYEFGKVAKQGVLEFPPDIPGFKEGQFKFYCPKIFMRLCDHFGIQCGEFYNSICNNAFVEFVSNSKSGAFFFFSNDGRYMIKTIDQGECKCLRQMLPKYYEHCIKNSSTLICRFYGLFRLRLNRRTHYFVIMESVFNTPKYIHLILDLKGSTTNRNATEKDLKATPTEHFTGTILKDNDLRNSNLCVDVDQIVACKLKTNLASDVRFLSSQGIIDYSLLVGIHYPDLDDPRTVTEKSYRRGSLSTNIPISPSYETKLHSLDGNDPNKHLEKLLDSNCRAAKRRSSGELQGVGKRKEVYFIGIIDILIQFGIFKGGEYLFKSKLKGHGERVSGV